MKQEFTMGSLFSGSGGFELAGLAFGIQPLWASEIEPLPILVTEKNIPGMKHLGDISKLNGAEIPKVDIITGGSPCQDMSIAGKREGLYGGRSGLFWEFIRVVKEMREDDKKKGSTHPRPRFLVWENVPGTFSSGKGSDFREVLQGIAEINDGGVFIPRPENGKWKNAGCIVADASSIAWRVLDAQYWGVPQRRRRIFLVADFGGWAAPEILFKREGMSWNFEEGEKTREGAASPPEAGTREAGRNSGVGVRSFLTIENHPNDCRIRLNEDGKVQTLTGRMGTGGGNVPLLLDSQGGANIRPMDGRVSPTLRARMNGRPPVLIDAVPIADKATRCQGGGATRHGDGAGNGLGVGRAGDPIYTLTAADRHAVAYGCRNHTAKKEVSGTLQAKGSGGHSLNYINPVAVLETAAPPEYIVRRLTPAECGRLQGFPDSWTQGLKNIKPDEGTIRHWEEVFEAHRETTGKPGKRRSRGQVIRWLKNPDSDTALYKMWGNGIALPCALYVFEGIAEILKGEDEMENAKIKPRMHGTPACEYGLGVFELLEQIALYQCEKETYSDIILGGGYGSIEENAGHILRAWMDADNLITLCRDFLQAEKNRIESELWAEGQKEKEVMPS